MFRLCFRIFCLPALAAIIIFINACAAQYFRSNYRDVNTLLHESDTMKVKPYLKAHLSNGEVYILKDAWHVDSVQDTLSGYGIRYDYNRNKISEGKVTIPIDDVVIFETNRKLLYDQSSRITALSILAGVDVILGIICITNPKACFGSCPTFYINEKENIHYADAEGFSNAISPALEYSDIDALNNNRFTGDTFSISMKNEALETHCVNSLELLAFPRNENQRVYHTPADDFFVCENTYPLNRASGPEGDLTTLLGSDDRQERSSLADRRNLSSREEICFEFDNVGKIENPGLIISFRQTLMTTYFIYSAIGYAGNEVGDIFARLETSDEINEKLKNGIKQELGNIDLYLWSEKDDDWKYQGGFYETGPIAFNHQLLPLTNEITGDRIRMKLVLNKGLWQVDYLALTNILNKAIPIEISPSVIFKNEICDSSALAGLLSPDKYLLSMPGDNYKINFILPERDRNYELFLCSKGYYLEWMRKSWIQDKNLLRLRQLIENPSRYLKAEAKRYKHYETTMVREFWSSKIDTETFSYHEN